MRLGTDRTAHRGSRGVALLFHDHSTRSGWWVNVTPRPLLTPGKTRYPLYWRLGGRQGRSGQMWKFSPSTGIRSRDRPACSSVAIPTELPGPQCARLCVYKNTVFFSWMSARQETVALMAARSLLLQVALEAFTQSIICWTWRRNEMDLVLGS
jgi:hypothetical protein